MFLKLIGYLCVCFVLGVRSQRSWGSSGGGYNSGFSSSWSSNNGFSNNRPSIGSANNAGTWESNAFGFGGRPNEKLSASPNQQNANWGYETFSNSNQNSGRNQEKPSEVNGGVSLDWQTDSSRRPNKKKLSSITNLPNSSKWSTNSNIFPSDEDNNLASSSWGSSNSRKPSSGQSSSQNSNYGNGYSNNLNSNQPNENEIFSESEYEDNSGYSSWASNNKKESKPASSSSSGSGNRESTTQKNKPQKPSSSGTWNSGDASQSGKEKPQTNTDDQNKKTSTLDTSILDELDKNDWYFGQESNYPKLPFRSTLNIDVSELWNFDKNKKSNQNSGGNSNKKNNNNNNQINSNSNNNNYSNSNSNNNNNNYSNSNSNNNNNNYSNSNSNNNNYSNSNSNNNNNNNNNNNINNNKSSNNNKNNNKNKYVNNNANNNRRWNRQIEGAVRIQCECVNVNLCDEEDMVVTQEDVKFDMRPLEAFRCDKLTEVCCINPKMNLASRANFNENKEQLRCGERRLDGKPFAEFGDDIVEPGEFPWNLILENVEGNCSASLVHHKMAVTAAHCIAGALPGELTIKAGVWNTKHEPPQSRKVTKIIPHPDYNSRNPRNDIALLILETPFELTDNVNTICLPVTNDKWDSNQCVVAGWRPKEIHGQALEVLEKGVVNFLPQPECQSIMLVTDLWRNYILHDSFVCGLEKTGKKSCTGDEGGFVVCPSRKKPDTYIQIGIVSKGMNCDEFGRPGIFTNILHFLDWINKTYFELGLLDEIDIRSFSE